MLRVLLLLLLLCASTLAQWQGAPASLAPSAPAPAPAPAPLPAGAMQEAPPSPPPVTGPTPPSTTTNTSTDAQPAAPKAPPAPACLEEVEFVNDTARVALCLTGRKAWKERRSNARTAQVGRLVDISRPVCVCVDVCWGGSGAVVSGRGRRM
jgi:hypothetical protein